MRAQYGRGKAGAESAPGMAAHHPVPRDRALAGQGMTAAAARRPAAPGEGFQRIEQTEYERDHPCMGPIQLRHALSQGGEAFGQKRRVMCHGGRYN